MRHLSILGGTLLLLAGCRDGPTAVGSGEPPASAPVTATAVAAQAAVDDVVDRVVPALGDGAGLSALAGSLQALQQALNAGRVAQGPGLARAARVQVDRYATLHAEQSAELDVVRLALGVIAFD